MQRAIKSIASVCCAALLAFGVIAAGGLNNKTVTADTQSYYAPITATGGNELLGQIHDLITTTHKYYASYNDCRDNAHTTDYAPGDEKSIIEFYTHETIVEYTKTGSDAGRWNREHVWPKALSNGLWGTDGGGSDMHHIRPTEVKMNSGREGYRYGEVTNGQKIYSKTVSGSNSQLGGYQAAGAFEPLDNVKGDVARIVMYVYTHYNTYQNVFGTTNGNGNSKYFGTLNFTHIILAGSEAAAKEIILKWNELDPVDEIEERRNEEVYKIQGNRNPFIDHPEYADAIWGGETLGGGQKHGNVEAFHAAVEEIVEEGSIGTRLASLVKAANALRAITDEAEKQLAAEDIAAFNEAIRKYNEYVDSCNRDAASANKAALESAGELIDR